MYDNEILEILGVPIAPISMAAPQLVSWKRPGSGTSGGSDLIRDSRGKLISDFAHYHGVATNTFAESCALRDRLAMCKERGWEDFVVESDSTLMVKWAHEGKCILWDLWKDIYALIETIRAKILSIYREGNMSANYLAKMGVTGNSFTM
ncbi:uncharacterized protein LOC111371165 [Olea europaea var. sylvestris]|uniref:uncharacterized protein LOC111371165 n=1 Tax=Olea europaea var. sylvestris TaxID=158386 RepID=UPI000C1D1F71|nr:uncharacterized protein LOC111371165 [Olea europaea var. sylvestris]